MKSYDLENVKFSYNSQNDILSIKNLTVQKGERVFIHGPSGSGKSTLLNMMAGVLAPTSGSLRALGKGLETLSVQSRDRFRGDHIGFIFQNFNLIPYLSIKDNISLPCRASKIRRDRSPELEKEINYLANHLGLSDILNHNVSRLSMGQQQRVGAARALIGSPEIIIADEPTSSLDDDIASQFIKLLMQEQEVKGFTLIFVSHDNRLKKYFPRTVALNEINHP